MGVIRKKTLSKGYEGGLKYLCDVCSADITSTVSFDLPTALLTIPPLQWQANGQTKVRIHCDSCSDYDLCVQCFKDGKSSRDHDPATHPYLVIEQHSIPIYDPEWGADEELCLLEGAETYGLGSWVDIADHIGGYRTKDEVRDHYIKTYIDSLHFPLPANADPRDKRLAEDVPREVFQARKKRRIEDCKEAAKTVPPATPKQKPTASVPACHEVQGYMPGRLEFETEFANEAEEAVQNMQFEPGDGLNPHTGELDPEMELKMVVMDIYNSRLTSRADRKKVIFEHSLLDYKKNTNLEKKKTKEEKALFDKCKPFARMMNNQDFQDFSNSINEEHNLRQAILQLQDWRRMSISDLKGGEKYETEKAARAARPPPTGVRAAEKKHEQKVVPDGTLELTAQELPERLRPVAPAPMYPASSTNGTANGTTTNGINGTAKGPLTNGTSNTSAPPPVAASTPDAKPVKSYYKVQPIPGLTPLKLNSDSSDLHLLTAEEADLCTVVNLHPKAYLMMKEAVIKEAMKSGGALKRKGVKEICKIDTTKASRLFDFFVHSGWIQKA